MVEKAGLVWGGIQPCIPSVQGLAALQQSNRGLLTCGVQSSGPAGPLGVSGGGFPELEDPRKATSTIWGWNAKEW